MRIGFSTLSRQAYIPPRVAFGSKVPFQTEFPNDESLKNAFRLNSPEEIIPLADRLFQDAPIRLMVTGRTGDDETYYNTVVGYLDALTANLKSRGKTVGFVTSASTKGIDKAATVASFRHGAKILYTGVHTPEQPYLTSASAAKIEQRIPVEVQPQIKQAPKYWCDSVEGYSRAGSLASNALAMFGGRHIALTDFMNNVSLGHKVLIMNDSRFGEVLNADESLINASLYVTRQVSALQAAQERLEKSIGPGKIRPEQVLDAAQLPYPLFEHSFSRPFVIEHLSQLLNSESVKIVGNAKAYYQDRDLQAAERFLFDV